MSSRQIVIGNEIPSPLHLKWFLRSDTGLVLRTYPQLAGVSAAMRAAVERRDIAGAVTVVAAEDRILHCGAVGLASLTNAEPMRPDSDIWIASMTQPVTAVAVLMLQDEGKLMIQGSDIGNSDASDIRRSFQAAAAEALPR